MNNNFIIKLFLANKHGDELCDSWVFDEQNCVRQTNWAGAGIWNLSGLDKMTMLSDLTLLLRLQVSCNHGHVIATFLNFFLTTSSPSSV